VDKLNYDAGSSPLKWTNRLIRRCLELVRVLFPVLLSTYLLLILIETVFEGSVSSYLNLNGLLIVVIIVGIIFLITAPAEADNKQGKHLTARNLLIMIPAGIGGAVIIWYKAQEIGWLSYVISISGGGLIMLLPMIIWRKSEGERTEEDNSQSN
jgi:predicted MFS family arabinose efflux permease